MTESPIKSSQAFTVHQMDREQEQCLLSHYGDPMNELRGFMHDIEYANHLLTESENIWVTVAEQENAVNSGLLALRTGFSNIDESPSPTRHSATWLYREKVFRHLRFVAKLEAISRRDLEFRFVTQYARYIYPKLLATIKGSQALQQYRVAAKNDGKLASISNE